MQDLDNIFIEKRYTEIIKESPHIMGKSFDRDLDYREFRINHAIDIIKYKKPIDNYSYKNINLSVYIDEGVSFDRYMFISPEPEYVAQFDIQEKNGGVYNGGVWQNRDWVGIARKLVFDYFLKKYDFFVSDSIQYVQGTRFWEKLLDEAIDKNYKIKIIDKLKNKEYDYRKIDHSKYSGRGDIFTNFLFKIINN